MAGPAELLIIMMMAGGGPIAGDDLLGFVDTQAYWGQKSVEVTIPAMSGELKSDVKGNAKTPAASVRRLMAIRTLGELRKAEATAALTPLLKSKEPFVADYAARAIAAIGNKKWTRTGVTKAMRLKDLGLLPNSCGIVSQTTLLFDQTQDLDEILKAAALAGGMTKEQVLRQMTTMVLQVAEKVGNIRLDSVTVGVARDVGNRTGFVVAAGRGLYDAKAVANALAPMVRETAEIEGMKVFLPVPNMAMMLPDNSRIVFVVGPKREALPLREVISALKVDKTGLQSTPEMAKLLKSVDMTADLWAVAEMSDTYRQAPPLAPLKWITLTGKQAKGAMNLTLLAEATDAQALSATVMIVEQGRQEGIREMQKALERQADMAPMIKPILELLQSVKVVRNGAKATLTATMTGGTSAAALMPVVFSTGAEGDGPGTTRPGRVLGRR